MYAIIATGGKQYKVSEGDIITDVYKRQVRANRDAALFDYTARFDGATINKDNILVTEEEIKEAYDAVDPKLLEVIRKSLVNIRTYHEKQRQNSWFDSQDKGIILGQKVTALARVGVYVPGGKAVYPSSVPVSYTHLVSEYRPFYGKKNLRNL